MKRLKYLFALFIIFSIMFAVFSSVVYATPGETKTLNITDTRPYGGAKYTVSVPSGLNNIVFKIGERNGTSLRFNDSWYCGRSGIGFGNSAGISNINNVSDVVYTETYNMKTDANTVAGYYRNTLGYNSISNIEYNSILWILDNMYLPEHEDATLLKANLINNVLIYDSANVSRSQLESLTDDDIEFVQQMALWYYTNYDEQAAGNNDSLSFPSTYVLSNATNVNNAALSNDKARAIDALYKYFINNATSHANIYGSGSAREYIPVKPGVRVNDSEKTVSNDINGVTVIGPFSMTTINGNINYILNGFQIKDGSAQPKTIPIKNEDNTDVVYISTDASSLVKIMQTKIDTLEDAIGQGDFYLTIANNVIETNGYNVNGLTIEPVCTYDISYDYKTTATFWISNIADTQPVIKVEKERIEEGQFRFLIEKRDEEGNLLYGATFELSKEDGSRVVITNNGDGTFNSPFFDITERGQTFIFNLEEIQGPEGYIKLDGKIKIKVTTNLNDSRTAYVAKTVEFVNTYGDPITVDGATFDIVDNTVKITVVNEKIKYFDMALRKFITKVNGNDLANTKEPNIDTTDLENDPDTTTADYKHRKNPTVVKNGDVITYRIAAYNEGEIEGVVTKIVDYLPEGLEFDTTGLARVNDGDDTKWVKIWGAGGSGRPNITVGEYYDISEAGRKITITRRITIGSGAGATTENYLFKLLPFNTTTVTYDEIDKEAYQMDFEDGLNYGYVEINCKVTAVNGNEDKILTNIATMEYAPASGENPDRDSHVDNLVLPNDDDLPDYKGNEENPDDLSISDNHYIGQEDDDDFDKVVIRGIQFDLALRKYITKVGKAGNYVDIANTKEPVIDTTDLENNSKTTAEYKHRKDPVVVEPGNDVVYNISVYNEGEIDGIVTEIVDYLPVGLSYDSSKNTALETNYTVIYDETTNTLTIKPKTGTNLFETPIKAYDSTKATAEAKLDVRTIELVCTVTANNTENDQILTNIASMKYAPADAINSNIKDRDSRPLGEQDDNFQLPQTEQAWSEYKGNERNPDDLSNSNNHYLGQQDDDDFDKVVIRGIHFDMALRKYIVKVNGSDIPNTKIPNINTVDLENGSKTTAEYKHRKDPVTVKVGDRVTYRISVYNEGDIDGIVTEIVDYLPTGLTYDSSKNTALETNYTVVYDETTNIITIKPKTGTNLFETPIKAYDSTKTTAEERLDVRTIELVCTVSASQEHKDRILTNIATMKYAPADTVNAGIKDRDSRPLGEQDDNFHLPQTEQAWSDYRGNNSNANKDLRNPDNYFEGQQDDDDFDKIMIPGVPFDLSLRKFITKVNGKEITSRQPMIDTSNLNKIGSTGNRTTTAKYTQPKDPVIVKKGDIVTYTIRVYNEGEIDGYATEVADYLPEGLGFLMYYKANEDNFWVPEQSENTSTIKLIGEGGIYATGSAVKNLKASDFNNNKVTSLSDVQIVPGKIKISSSALEFEKIKAYNPELQETDIDSNDKWQKSTNGTDGLYYQDIEITCIVLAENTFNGQLINIAEVEDDKPVDENDNTIPADDRDSNPDDVNIDDYTPPEDNSTYQEDDDDYEPLELRYFDLALRKFITAVNEEGIATRIPVPRIKEDGTIEYVHDKTPVLVENSDIVTYTIRVYNEGTVQGYAMEISDDIPEGLVFLPDHTTNITYKWIMLDANGQVTEDPLEAVEIRTKYLENRLLKPYDSTKSISVVEPLNPDYAEVKVAFKIAEKDVMQPDRIVMNKAQITKDKPVDENGNELDIPDEDSIPGKWNPGEDDQDVEYVYVKIFDLALLKWVTKTIVIVDGKTTTTETGFTPYDNPEPIAKVVVDKKKLSKTTVKFVYKIMITNQGEIPGYATEITDYIPAGLEFVEEDNPTWTKEGNGKIVTRALERKLLQPGESATVEVVFRWKQNANNLGVKTNIAEISEDYNESGTPDKDSEPDNVRTPNYDRQQEDDDDKALVMLELKTGGFKKSYLWVGLVFITIIALGIILIKKYVL